MLATVLRELQRRNVIRAAILFVTGVWALAQGIAALGPSLGIRQIRNGSWVRT